MKYINIYINIYKYIMENSLNNNNLEKHEINDEINDEINNDEKEKYINDLYRIIYTEGEQDLSFQQIHIFSLIIYSKQKAFDTFKNTINNRKDELDNEKIMYDIENYDDNYCYISIIKSDKWESYKIEKVNIDQFDFIYSN